MISKENSIESQIHYFVFNKNQEILSEAQILLDVIHIF